MDDLLPGMLHLVRDGGETLTRQLTDQLRGLITWRPTSRPASACPRAGQLAQSLGPVTEHRLVCDRAIGRGRLCHPFRRTPPVVAEEGCRSIVDKLPSRSSRGGRRADKRIDLGEEPSTVGLAADPQGCGPGRFSEGLADEREFPHDEWSRCLRRGGEECAGHAAIARSTIRRCRKPLLRHLAVHRGIEAVANQILFVPTAQAGLMLVADALLEPGDRAWVESPGYGGADVAFRAAGASVSAIPLDAQGMASFPRTRKRPG